MVNFYSLGPNEYYIRQETIKNADYEEAYWGIIVDPDGNVRNRMEEREYHLENVKQEVEFINSLSPGRVLDIGCGAGFLLSGINDKWEKFGVEVSHFAAEYAKKEGKIYVGELQDAHFPNEFFDLIVMHHVIEHIKDPISIIVEVHRILKKSGILLLGTPDFDSGCARRFKGKYRLLYDSTHTSLFSNDSMHRFLRDHNFIIDRVEYPFFDTRYFTIENLMRLFDISKISPPFYGSFMTFYCHKPDENTFNL